MRDAILVKLWSQVSRSFLLGAPRRARDRNGAECFSGRGAGRVSAAGACVESGDRALHGDHLKKPAPRTEPGNDGAAAGAQAPGASTSTGRKATMKASNSEAKPYRPNAVSTVPRNAIDQRQGFGSRRWPQPPDQAAQDQPPQCRTQEDPRYHRRRVAAGAADHAPGRDAKACEHGREAEQGYRIGKGEQEGRHEGRVRNRAAAAKAAWPEMGRAQPGLMKVRAPR